MLQPEPTVVELAGAPVMFCGPGHAQAFAGGIGAGAEGAEVALFVDGTDGFVEAVSVGQTHQAALAGFEAAQQACPVDAFAGLPVWQGDAVFNDDGIYINLGGG